MSDAGDGDGGGDRAGSRLELTAWRRTIAALYADVRDVAVVDPAAAWQRWRSEREALYRGHPQSPVPAAERATFTARHWPYDERLRFVVPVQRVVNAPRPAAGVAPAGLAPTGLAAAGLALPNSGADTLAFDRIGVVELALPGGHERLPLFWMRGYAGGLFLPFGDATNGAETYGAGRYILDTAKGADLGGDPGAGTVVVDLNFAFQPSCAFDPRWACPLAPPESRLRAPVEAGEQLR